MTRVSRFARALLDVALPPRCIGCDALGAEPFCSECAAWVEPVGVFAARDLDWAAAGFAYGGPVAEAIQRIKYDGLWQLARPLGEVTVGRLSTEKNWSLAVPVPSTPTRIRARGSNPARELARRARLRIDALAMTRNDGPTQVGKSRVERFANLRRAFAADAGRVRGHDVLIIDDVYTTGATASAVARVLRRAGARRVGLAVAARVESIESRVAGRS